METQHLYPSRDSNQTWASSNSLDSTQIDDLQLQKLESSKGELVPPRGTALQVPVTRHARDARIKLRDLEKQKPMHYSGCPCPFQILSCSVLSAQCSRTLSLRGKTATVPDPLGKSFYSCLSSLTVTFPCNVIVESSILSVLGKRYRNTTRARGMRTDHSRSSSTLFGSQPAYIPHTYRSLRHTYPQGLK